MIMARAHPAPQYLNPQGMHMVPCTMVPVTAPARKIARVPIGQFMASQLHRPSATMLGACQKPFQMLPGNELAPAFTGVKLAKVHEENPRYANRRVPLAPLYGYGKLRQVKEMQDMKSEADKIASLKQMCSDLHTRLAENARVTTETALKAMRRAADPHKRRKQTSPGTLSTGSVQDSNMTVAPRVSVGAGIITSVAVPEKSTTNARLLENTSDQQGSTDEVGARLTTSTCVLDI